MIGTLTFTPSTKGPPNVLNDPQDDTPRSSFGILRTTKGLSQIDVLRKTHFKSFRPIRRADQDLEGFRLWELRVLAGAIGVSLAELLRGSIEHVEPVRTEGKE